MENDYKALLIGRRKVGKTAMRNLWCSHFFNDEYEPSYGVCWALSQENEKRVNVYDCSEENTVNGITFDVILLIFDLGCKESFEDCKEFHQKFHQNPCILIGYKKDTHCEVNPSEISSFIHTFQIPYFEVSLLTGENLESLFASLYSKYFL